MDNADSDRLTQSAWEEARSFGVDLSLLEENLLKTAEELIAQQSAGSNSIIAFRAAVQDSYGE